MKSVFKKRNIISSHREQEEHHRKKIISGKWGAIATMTGTIIGAGFLGIPYVSSKAGFLVGVGYIVVLGLIMMLVNLYYSEIILRTKKIHQVPGYAGKYLGKFGEIIAFIALFFGIYTALLAYILAEGKSLSFLILSNTNTINVLIFGTLFFALVAYINHKGLKALKRYEFIGFIIIVLIVLAIAGVYGPSINFENFGGFNAKYLFLPFGVVLFALLGMESATEARLILKNNKDLKKVTIISSIIPIAFYLVFSFVVVGRFSNIPEVATLALGKIFVFLGMISIFTAAFALCMILNDSYRLDMGLNKKWAWVLSVVVPYVLFLIVVGFNLLDFIGLLGLGGSITGGLTAILVLLMVRKAKQNGERKPEYSVYINWLLIGVLSLIFLGGIVYAFWKFLM